jgi:hypothetical protein
MKLAFGVTLVQLMSAATAFGQANPLGSPSPAPGIGSGAGPTYNVPNTTTTPVNPIVPGSPPTDGTFGQATPSQNPPGQGKPIGPGFAPQSPRR